MEKTNELKTVPAGKFNVINLVANMTLYPSDDELYVQLELNNYYAPNIGPILKSYIWVQDCARNKNKIEMRLTKYHIQE
jgi:hypothetical protein